MAKKYNFKVTSRECRGNKERMIRKANVLVVNVHEKKESVNVQKKGAIEQISDYLY